MALLYGGIMHAAALGETGPARVQATAIYQTPEQAFTEAMRRSIGAPALAELGDQATVRLAEDLIIVPQDQAARLLTIWGLTVPPDFVALLLGPKGMNSPGIIRYVPAGFTDLADAAAWTPEDFLSSIQDTVESRNADRARRQLPELEVRRWLRPPRIDAANGQISWAALVLPKSAPQDADGAITFNAASFGRHGYVELSMVTSVQDAGETGTVFETFLNGVAFRPGETYGDAQAADLRSKDGLTGVLGIDVLHKARSSGSFWRSDLVIPAAGGLVALIGALSLVGYVRRYWRHESRRW
jgi:uncharacterized membrane-anchored protein